MTDTLDLFTSYPHVPFVKGSPTSQEAANAIEPRIPTLKERVYEFIRLRKSYGVTDEELAHYLQMNPSTARPRRRELELKGLIKKAGVTRPGRSGKAMTVWVAA